MLVKTTQNVILSIALRSLLFQEDSPDKYVFSKTGEVYLFVSDDYTNNRGVWIGLNDVNRTGSYHWSACTGLVFTKWASGQPDQRYNNQHCVTLMDDGTGHWEDVNCDHKLAFICQKNA